LVAKRCLELYERMQACWAPLTAGVP
jgi:hypothetical protein